MMVTDASQKDAVECLVGYAAFRHVFNECLAPAGRRPPPTRLVLFRRLSTFQQYCGNTNMENLQRCSLTFEVDRHAVVAFSLAGDRRDAMRTIFLFDTVWSLQRVGYSLPLWVIQGAGEVLSTLRLKKGECILGEEPDGYWHLLDYEQWFSWPQFSDIDTASPEYYAFERHGVYYAQAWALMHMTLLGGPTGIRDRFEALAAQVRETPRADETVAAVLHLDAKRMEQEINRHLRKDLQVKIPFDEKTVRAGLKVSPVSECEVRLQLANLLLTAGKNDEANLELQRARALAPEAPMVKEALARRELLQGKRDLASELYREAIAVGSVNPAAYLASAEQRLADVSLGGRDLLGEGGIPAEKAKAEIRRAIELDPGNGEAYRLLGRAFLVARHVTTAEIDELAPGVAAAKQGAWVRYYRALLYWRLGQVDACQADFQRIIDDPQAQDDARNMARQQSERMRIEAVRLEVKRLVEERKFSAALELVDASAHASRPADEQYQTLRAWIEEQAAQAGLKDHSAAGQ
ncbi:MAG: hypothetical protein PHE83_01495 [Opitutaceae bacterium]|nr:hypothetical protein [Opitutaceae bacterium]